MGAASMRYERKGSGALTAIGDQPIKASTIRPISLALSCVMRSFITHERKDATGIHVQGVARSGAHDSRLLTPDLPLPPLPNMNWTNPGVLSS